MEIAKQLTAINAKIYGRGLNTSRDGNISVRHGGRIYMTPTKYRGPCGNEGITPESILNWSEREHPSDPIRLSSEWKHHVRVYATLPTIGAIIHCHAPHATAMASRPDGTRLCELLAQFSEFKLYDNPPVMSAPEQIIPPSEKLADAHTVLCPFHGVTAFGRDLVHAFERLERLEFYARTVLLMT